MLSLFLLAAERLTIRLSSPALLPGGFERVTCRVPRDAANRNLSIGLTNYTSSDFQLDGEESRITFQVDFPHVPCEATSAYCLVTRNDASVLRVQQAITIAMCDEPQ